MLPERTQGVGPRYTSFTCDHILYRFIRMPLGIRNAPGIFRRTMDLILKTVKWQFALVYLDCIFVFSRILGEHAFPMWLVLKLLNTADVSFKVKRCEFLTDTTNCIGHLIRPSCFVFAFHSTDAIRGLQELTTLPSSNRFLLCSMYSDHSFQTLHD